MMVLRALGALARHERHQANILSVTAAKLGLLAVSALSTQADAVGIEEFLPFPLEQAPGASRMSEQTAATVKAAIRSGQIPAWALPLLAEEMGGASALA
jgi:hypothetical protein